MRHVPEDELHAYLDQALSRSQCVEIETHLAACGYCRDARDSVAALRDRTTALLGRLQPRPLIVPPPFEALARRPGRFGLSAVWERRLRRAGLWAASVASAVGLGWGARSVLDPHRISLAVAPAVPAALAPAPVVTASVPPATPSELEQVATPAPIQEHPVRYVAARPAADRRLTQVVPAPSFQLASGVVASHEMLINEKTPAATPESHSPFDRIWRAVSWEEALKVAGSGLPYIEGMPVVGVLLQPGAAGERPMVIVAQQDPGGEVIQSIEGPVAKVNDLLQRQTAPDIHSSVPARTPPDYVDGVGGVRRALRILTVTGRLSSDSLNALARVATIR